MIDMVLYKNKIPFRYECALRFGETVFYPDFTIRQTYTSHGIIPTIQLITTYETKDYPLSIETVEEIVKHYFL